MTRFLKSTLGLVALLLVVVMAFASCANEEALKQSIDKVQTDANNAQNSANQAQTDANKAQNSANNAQNSANNAQSSADKAQNSANNAQNSANNAQNSADKAQTDAATALAEAKKALTEATAALQAAIDTKATPADITAEVAKVTAAIEAAKTLASTADGALKAELLGAIETAKAAVKLESESIAKNLDAAYTELINSKANDAETKDALEALKDLIDAADAVADGAINTFLFTDLSKTVVVERRALEARVAQLEAQKNAGLYTEDNWTDIKNAYFAADTYILRATSLSVIEQAWDEFELVVKNFKMPVDELYYDLLALNKDTASLADVKEIFETAKDLNDDSKYVALTRDYYDDSDLYAIAADLYISKLTPILSELGARYLVYPQHEVGAQDKLDLEAARTELNAFDTIFFDGTNYSADLDNAKVEALKTAIANFVANETRMTDLEGAVAAAEALRTERFDSVTLVQATIDGIQTWQKSIVDWETMYIPAVANATTATTERRALTAALITTAKTAMEADLAELNELINEYKKTAFESFQQAVSYFYKDTDAPAQTNKDLVGKALDLSKVNLASWGILNDAWNNAQLWKANNLLGLENIYGPDEKKPAESEKEISQLWVKYQKIAAVARQDWADLNKVDIDKVNVYDETVRTALTWFAKDYVLIKDGAIVWDTVNGVEAYNLYRPEDGQPDVIVTKAYYEQLKDLMGDVEEMIELRNDAADKLIAAIGNLPDPKNTDPTKPYLTFEHYEAVIGAEDLRKNYMLALDEAGKNIYVENHEYNAYGGRDFTISTELLTKLSDALAKIDAIRAELKDLYDALEAMPEIPAYVDYTAYPFFNDDDNKQTDFDAALQTLKTALADFLKENNNGETFTIEVEYGDATLSAATVNQAKTAILEARKTIAKEAIYAKMADLLAANEKLTATALEGFRNEFFNAEIAQADYELLIKALDDAIKAQYDTDFVIADSDVTDARDAVKNANDTVKNSKINVEFNDMVEAYNVLKAITVTDDDNYEAENPFIAAGDETAYGEAIAALKQAIADFKAVEGAVDDDAKTYEDELAKAEALVVKNNVYKEYQKVKTEAKDLDDITVRDDNDYEADTPFIADQGAYEQAIKDLKDAIDAFETVEGYEAVAGLADHKKAVADAEALVDKNIVYKAYVALKAKAKDLADITVRNDANFDAETPFIAADVLEAYKAAIGALATEITTFEAVEGSDVIDITAIKNAVTEANVLVAKNEVYAVYLAFKVAKINSVYPYFDSAVIKGQYETAIGNLKTEIAEFKATTGAVAAEVEGIEEAITKAEKKVADYEKFEADYTSVYTAAVNYVEAQITDATQNAAAKAELKNVLQRYHDAVGTVDLADANYYANYKASLDAVLAYYNLDLEDALA